MLTRPQRIEAQNSLSQLYRDWHLDRELQHRVPLRQCWRGCLGLALLVDRFDDHALSRGLHTFLPNHALTWLALRDLPPNQCPGDATRDFRGACLASAAQATLAYGRPHLDFTHNARDHWDLKRRPVHSGLDGRPARLDILDARHHAREWAVLNRLSAAMTDFAFNARDLHGLPIRRAWHLHRPNRCRPYPPTSATLWFPTAYLAFPSANRRRLTLPRHTQDAHGLPADPIVRVNPQVTLIPASRLGRAQPAVAPMGLWWDVSSSASHLDVDLEAFVFPPLPLRACHRLRQALPGDVQLLASFGDSLARTDVPGRPGHAGRAPRLPLRPALAA